MRMSTLATARSLMMALTFAATVAGAEAQAVPTDLGGFTTNVDTSWVTGAVMTDALKMTKTLPREVVTYHYVPRMLVQNEDGSKFPRTGPVDVNDAKLQQVVHTNMFSRIIRFWDTSLKVSGRSSDGGAMAPNGLYVAMEPVISKRYGDEGNGNTRNWMMYQVVVPAGTRYVDGRYRQVPIGENMRAALNARGCNAPSGFTTRDLIKSDTDKVACRQALNDIAAATEAKMVAYFFLREPLKDDCYEWSSAFVVIHPKAIGQVDFLVQDQPVTPDQYDDVRANLNAVFRRAGLGPLFPYAAATTDEAARGYIKDNYFTCNKDLLRKEL